MKTKLVLWGTNATEERVLIALELHPEKNKIDIWVFPESVSTDDFAKSLLNDWRNDAEVAFPDEKTHLERELSMTESLLPEDLKVERGDIIQRAQTEWHFIVLSSKLNEAYQSELSELKEKIDKLTNYDNNLWNSLKEFWNKVQEQVRDRNLFRDHADSLRDSTNALFTQLKQLRSVLDEEFRQISQGKVDQFMASLEVIEKKITEGLRLTTVFEELKNMQREFRDSKLTREHRSKVWEKLDAAFKLVKEKRFGAAATGNTGSNSPMDRLKRRYDGLLSAIEKMNRSIKRDEEDLEFQNRKIATTNGQLEAQIRQAKILMIEERIRSKKEKMGEMGQTKTELESRIESQTEKDKKRAEKERVEEAQATAKAKIAEEMKVAAEARKEEEGKLEKAAEAIIAPTKEEAEDKDESIEEVASVITSEMDKIATETNSDIESPVEDDVIATASTAVELVQGHPEPEIADKEADK